MGELGVELELAVLLGMFVIGTQVFAPFEVETPPARKILKWLIVIALTLGLTRVMGHWAIAVPLGLGLAGLTFHWYWCKKHGIHPLRATPRRRYYELRGWEWLE